MHRLCLVFSLSLLCATPVFAPAFAEVREASFGIENQSALSLIRFDMPPGKITVHTNSVSPNSLEVLIEGVHAQQARITPPDTHLVQSFEITPTETGVRLIYHFTDEPAQCTAQAYDHAVLVRAHFEGPLRMQSAALKFNSSAAPSPKIVHQGIREKPAAAAPTRDGVIIAPENPVVRGTGMIRDAAASTRAPSLDATSCAAAQKAIEDDPWALDKLSIYGACIAKDGKINEAKEVFERLLTFDPDMISAHVGLGAIAQENGESEAARRYYQQALGLGGSDAEAAQVRALIGTLGKTP